MRPRYRVLIAVVIGVVAVDAFLYLGPDLAFSIAARAVIASIVYRLIRRGIR